MPETTGTNATVSDRAGRAVRSWLVLLAVVALGLAADLGSKWWAFASIADRPVVVDRDRVLEIAQLQGPEFIGHLLPEHRPVVVVPHLLELSLVLNPGAVFGIGPGKRWFFIVFTVGAMIAGLFLFARGTRQRQTPAHVAIGLLIAGGLGNLYDRLMFGCVRDFLHPLPGVEWPLGITVPWGGRDGRQVWPYVSNIADLWLIIGIGMLVVILWRSDSAERRTQLSKGGA